MTFETLNVETDDRGVATVTLNRPEKHNALNGQLIGELRTLATQLNGRHDVRVVVLTGQGKSFCAGGDLNWMKAQIAADDDTKRNEATALAQMLNAWNTLSKPVIGRINGNALGGGVGMSCICDVSVGVIGAKFGLTETKLGLIPATIGPYVLARMGEAKARRVFMSSRVFGAEEAETLGILSKAVDVADLDAAVEAEIKPYLSCKPGAVASAKALARSFGPTINDVTINRSIDALIDRWRTQEAIDGIAEFFGD